MLLYCFRLSHISPGEARHLLWNFIIRILLNLTSRYLFSLCAYFVFLSYPSCTLDHKTYIVQLRCSWIANQLLLKIVWPSPIMYFVCYDRRRSRLSAGSAWHPRSKQDSKYPLYWLCYIDFTTATREFRTGACIFRFWIKDFRSKRRFSFAVLQVNSRLPFTMLNVSYANSEFFFHLRAWEWGTPLNYEILHSKSEK